MVYLLRLPDADGGPRAAAQGPRDARVAVGYDRPGKDVLEQERAGGEELAGSKARPILVTNVYVIRVVPRYLHRIDNNRNKNLILLSA